MGASDPSVIGTRSPVKIMSNIFIAFLGAGVLGLPFAFKEAGILEGTVIMASVGLVSVKAMLLLIDCKYKIIQDRKRVSEPLTNGKGHVTVKMQPEESEKPLITQENGGMECEEESHQINHYHQHDPHQLPDISYGDVGYVAMGPTGRFLVDLSIVVSQIGFCCAYIIFISENLSAYIEQLDLTHWLMILLPPLAALTLLRHLSSLALSSVFAQMSNLLAFAVVFWFDFEHFAHVHRRIHPKEISLKGFPFFLAIAIYCYEGAGMILSLEASLAADIRHKFKFYFKSVLVIVTALYISFGCCGYLSFGPETNPIITLNLPKGAALDFAIIVKSCLCLGLFFTYPVMMFPVAKIIERKVLPGKGAIRWQGNVLRVSLVVLTGIIVLAIPNFANLMALVGSTCCTLIAFTLPGIFHSKIFKGSITKGAYYFDVFLVLLGCVGAVIGTADALVRLREVDLPESNTAGLQLLDHNHTLIATAAEINGTLQIMLPPGVTDLRRHRGQEHEGNGTASVLDVSLPDSIQQLIDSVNTSKIVQGDVGGVKHQTDNTNLHIADVLEATSSTHTSDTDQSTNVTLHSDSQQHATHESDSSEAQNKLLTKVKGTTDHSLHNT